MTHFTEIVNGLRASVLSGDFAWADDLLADEVVIEYPFAAPGRPKRYEGKAAFLAMARPGRAAMPFTFDICHVHTVHQTGDPEVIVVEYEAGALVHGERRSSAIVAVIRIRGGKVVLWREYQDTYAIVQALGLP